VTKLHLVKSKAAPVFLTDLIIIIIIFCLSSNNGVPCTGCGRETGDYKATITFN